MHIDVDDIKIVRICSKQISASENQDSSSPFVIYNRTTSLTDVQSDNFFDCHSRRQHRSLLQHPILDVRTCHTPNILKLLMVDVLTDMRKYAGTHPTESYTRRITT
jgi:hypothetical protein